MNMNDINTNDFISDKLTNFCRKDGFIKAIVQPDLDILAACEDPDTIAQFIFSGVNYPLPQTGQMRLEEILLSNPVLESVFCETASYRNELFPIEGRHDKTFMMFEFEKCGNFFDLRTFNFELLKSLGFDDEPVVLEYDDACEELNVSIIGDGEEMELQERYGNIISLERFPQRSHPFWNMKQKGHNSKCERLFNKIDVILYGMETIGSAERSCSPGEMLEGFNSVSDGKYAKKLFSLFGEERVMRELYYYLSLDMRPRFGGGIGFTRLIRALRLQESGGD